MKNFHLDLIRVTESGAIAAAEWVGHGNKEEADRAATNAMRDRLNKMHDFYAMIAIGEGKKDNSHGLYEGEYVGATVKEIESSEYYNPDKPDKKFYSAEDIPHSYEIAVDPIEGTTPTAKGGNEAISVIALGYKDAFYKTEDFYMYKLAAGPKAWGYNIDVKASIGWNISGLAMALHKPVARLTVCVLDRPRHGPLVEELRSLGCRIKFISDCDVTACVATCIPDSGIDMYIGAGGAPEAVIAAAAIKCMGGLFQVTSADKDGKIIDGPVLGIEELAKGPVMFSATGITDGSLLRGVRFTGRGPVTESIAMRSESNTIRKMTTEHGN